MHWLRQSVPLLFRRCVEGSGALDEAALKVGEGTGAPESHWMVKSVDVELKTVSRREKKPRHVQQLGRGKKNSCHVMDVAGVLRVGREVDHCDRQREASRAGRYARCRVSRVGGHGAGGPSVRAQHALKTFSNTNFFSY